MRALIYATRARVKAVSEDALQDLEVPVEEANARLSGLHAAVRINTGNDLGADAAWGPAGRAVTAVAAATQAAATAVVATAAMQQQQWADRGWWTHDAGWWASRGW